MQGCKKRKEVLQVPLNYEQFIDVLNNKPRATQGVPRGSLYSLRRGLIYKKFWKEAEKEGFTPMPSRKFTKEQVFEIYESRLSSRELAKKYSTSHQNILHIRKGVSYKYFREQFIRDYGNAFGFKQEEIH